MTNKDKDEREKETAEHPASDPSRLPYFSEALAMNPLLANPAAAMAAATAIGLGFASQMASAFFGVMQNTMEAANRQNAAQAAETPASVETLVAAGAVAAEPENVPAPAVAQPKASAAKEPVARKKPAKKAVAVKPASAEASAPADVLVEAGAAAAEPTPVVVAPKAKSAAKAAKPASEKKSAVKKAAVAKAAPTEVAAKPAAKARAAAAKPKAATKIAVAAEPAKAAAKPKVSAKAADLKRISGIGPKLESLLKDKGIALAQVAAWTDADIARLDTELGLNGRIAQDDWVGQAKALLQ